MYNEELENLIDAALADGVMTEKEKQILFKKAQAMGVDLDEFEMVLDARLVKMKKAEQEKAASSAPKSNKLGDVKKCPSCGAMVQSYQGVCPECGYAFEGIDANSAVKELSNLLQKAPSEAKMEGIIDNYPIPMEKASLLAFITWLRPQSLDVDNPLSRAYQRKYAECANKIRVAFASDKDLQSFITQYDVDSKKIKKQRVTKKILNFLKKPISWAILAVFIISSFLIVRSIVRSNSITRNAVKCSAAIEKAIKEENTQKAIDLYMNFKNKKVLLNNGTAMAVFDACLEKSDFNTAKKIVNSIGGKWSDHPSEIHPGDQMAVKLYETCITQGQYEMARELMSGSLSYGYYLNDVVMQMCKNGDKEGAKTFVKDNIGKVDRYNDNFCTFKKPNGVSLEDYLNNLIDNY